MSLKVIDDVCSSTLTFISRMKEILKPPTQACVGLTLSNLYRIYSTANIEASICSQVLGGFGKKWYAADQDVFILAMHLHP
jgi:hypothetical protein